MAAEEQPQIIDGLPLIESATGLKNDGNAKVKEQQFQEAVTIYEKAIAELDKADGHPMLREEVGQMLSLKSVLYANVAQCMLNQKLYRRAVEAATTCLSFDDQNTKALNRRAQAYEALQQYPKALADMVELQKLGGGGLSPEAVEAKLKPLRDKIAEIERLKAEESSDDEWGLEMVRMKEKFDEVVAKYDLREDENFASEVADWLVSGEWVVTVKRVAQRWKMEVEDAEDFLKWISKGVEFKAENSSMSDLMGQQAPALGAPDKLDLGV
jgi:tetratricopeptide (TPR) repeat protein